MHGNHEHKVKILFLSVLVLFDLYATQVQTGLQIKTTVDLSDVCVITFGEKEEQ